MLLCTSVVQLCPVIIAHTSRLEPLLLVLRSLIDWLIAAYLTHSNKLFMHSQNENKTNSTCIYKPSRHHGGMAQSGFHFWLTLEINLAISSGYNVYTLYRMLQERAMAIVFKATFNNTSVISWRSVLSTRRKRPTCCKWLTIFYHITLEFAMGGIRINNISGDLHWLHR